MRLIFPLRPSGVLERKPRVRPHGQVPALHARVVPERWSFLPVRKLDRTWPREQNQTRVDARDVEEVFHPELFQFVMPEPLVGELLRGVPPVDEYGHRFGTNRIEMLLWPLCEAGEILPFRELLHALVRVLVAPAGELLQEFQR